MIVTAQRPPIRARLRRTTMRLKRLRRRPKTGQLGTIHAVQIRATQNVDKPQVSLRGIRLPAKRWNVSPRLNPADRKIEERQARQKRKPTAGKSPRHCGVVRTRQSFDQLASARSEGEDLARCKPGTNRAALMPTGADHQQRRPARHVHAHRAPQNTRSPVTDRHRIQPHAAVERPVNPVHHLPGAPGPHPAGVGEYVAKPLPVSWIARREIPEFESISHSGLHFQI